MEADYLEVMLLAGKIEVKDDLQMLADFMLEMILKYGNKVDVDSLPDPEVYFLVKSIKKLNKLMAEKREEVGSMDIEYVLYT